MQTGRRTIWVISVGLVLTLLAIFLLPRHPVPSFVRSTGIPLSWDAREHWFQMSCQEQDNLQKALKDAGYVYEGSADMADDHGMYGTNFWLRGRDRIEEGQTSSNGDMCMAKF